MRKFTFLLLAALAGLPAARAQVSLSESGLSPDSVYTFVTSRGGWYADTQFKSTKDASATVSATDANQHFALVPSPDDESIVYLFSVGQKKFVRSDRSLTTGAPSQIYIFNNTNDTSYPYFFSFTQDKSNYNINLGGSQQMTVDSWATYDAGNKVKVTPVMDDTYSLTEAQEILKSFSVSGGTQGYQTTAQGNDSWLIRSMATGKATGETTITKIFATLKGTTAQNVEEIRLYVTPTDTDNLILYSGLTPVTTATVSGNDVTLAPEGGLVIPAGAVRYLWLTAKVKDDATFGATIDASMDSLVADGTTLALGFDPEGEAKIFKTQVQVLPWWSFNTKIYRIPAMIQANDGTVVCVADDRRYHGADAGSGPDDLVYRYSTDRGKTWSDRYQLAVASGTRGDGSIYSYGDPAIGKTKSGKLIVLSCATDKGFFSGQTSPYIFTSGDGGKTWDAGRTINTTDGYYDAIAGKAGFQQFSTFVTSGRFITTKTGRLMANVPVILADKSTRQDFILYSDDEGETWTLDDAPVWNANGDEAKVVQRKDGSILASIRSGGGRGFNVGSSDGTRWMGQWKSSLPDPGCNEDIIAYGDSTVLLHTSLTGGRRANLHIYTSHDQGQTWVDRLQIQPGDAAYSTMEELDNGDLAVFYEDGCLGHSYDMNYVVIPAEEVQKWIDAETPTSKDYSQNVQDEYGMWFADGVATEGYFTMSQASHDDLAPLYAERSQSCDIDQYFAFADSISAANYNMPATGYYRLSNYGYTSGARTNNGRYLAIDLAASLATTNSQTTDAGTIFLVEKNDDGTYALRSQGKYVGGDPGANETLWPTSTTAVKFAADVMEPGIVALRPATAAQGSISYLHNAAPKNGANRIVRWYGTTAPSQWVFEDAESLNVVASQIGDSVYAAVNVDFPFQVEGAKTGIVYAVAADQSSVLQTETDVVPAATPAVITAPAELGTTLTLSVANDAATTAESNVLTGVYFSTSLTAGNLTFGAQDGVPGFWKTSAATTLAANKAYLPATSYTADGNGLPLTWGDPTGISTVNAAPANSSNAVYDLQGRRVKAGQKGIYIQNGKKLLHF